MEQHSEGGILTTRVDFGEESGGPEVDQCHQWNRQDEGHRQILRPNFSKRAALAAHSGIVIVCTHH